MGDCSETWEFLKSRKNNRTFLEEERGQGSDTSRKDKCIAVGRQVPWRKEGKEGRKLPMKGVWNVCKGESRLKQEIRDLC